MRHLLGLLLVLGSAACGDPAATEAATGPTFARDVAPLVYRSCTPCHRDGQPAPFALQSYADVHRKRAQIVEVIEQRVMPPWLMTHGDFAGDRRLAAAEIDLLRRWVENGALRGDAASEPPVPVFAAGWQLREPDLVVTAPDALTVPAAGPNLFRNLVIPVDAGPLRYVEAVEIRPASRAVHHAVLAVDATRESRRLDALDTEPGFLGMVPGAAVPPDGHFLGWTPGKQVRRNPPGMAWRLYPGQDLVLQVHLVPTGKVETVQPQIGLFFTNAPTTIVPYPVALFSEQIDLQPGERDFVLRDHLTVPVPITVHRVYPHAHYLCRRMRAWATLPDGSERVLFAIDAWDFDWQDDYAFREPLQLPAGARLAIEYHYDNSDANPANPHRPPVHVRFGQESADEMGTLTLMVTAADAAQRLQLAEACHGRDVEKCPADARLLLRLAGIRRELGKAAAAIADVQRAIGLRPDDPEGYYELGVCHERAARATEAEGAYRQALALAPQHAWANLQLGGLLARAQHTKAAIGHFEAALATLPNLALLHCNLGTAHFVDGDLLAAEARYRRAISLDPGYGNAHFLLGRLLLQAGRRDEARTCLQQARRLLPDHAGVKVALEQVGG